MARIESSRWTGTLEERGLPARPLAPGARITSPAPELRPLLRQAALLFVSPILLWCSWLFVRFATSDYLVADHGDLLMTIGSFAALAGGLTFTYASKGALQWGALACRGAILAIVVLAGWYAYEGITAHRLGTVTSPVRAFEIVEYRGSRAPRRAVHHFQRADGSFIGESRQDAPVGQGHVCVDAQEVAGDHGFAWVRVLDRSRAPTRGQLLWPISADECFSNTPLSELPS